MRIAHLAPAATARNGIADYARHWQLAMRAAGVEVVCPALDDASLDLPALLDRHGVELVHAELGGGRVAEFDALARIRKTRPGLPLSATVHDPERLIWRASHPAGPAAWLARGPAPLPQLAGLLDHRRVLRMERELAQQLDAVICMTHRGSEALAQRMQLPAGRSHTIAHGQPQIPARPLPTGPLRLLYFGYIYPGKGIEDLLQAFAGLCRAGASPAPAVRLTLAGGTAAEVTFGRHDSYLQMLQQRVRHYRLESQVDWQTDVPAEAIATLIQAHHVMVLPYRESWKLAWLGQMRSTSGALAWATACGRGAIVSDARAFAEEISHGNGCQFRHRDPQDLQRCLEALVARPELAAQWAASAEKLALTRQWPRIADQYRKTFAELLENRAHG